MGKYIRMIFVFGLVSLTTVGCGCSKKNPPSQQAMINACLFDATGNCPRQAAAIAQAGGFAGGAPGMLPPLGQNSPILTNPAVGGIPGMTPPGTTAPMPIKAFASNVDVRNQQQKVMSALNADKNNPNSMRYDPPSTVLQRDPAAVDAAHALPTQNDQVGLKRDAGASDRQSEAAGTR